MNSETPWPSLQGGVDLLVVERLHTPLVSYRPSVPSAQFLLGSWPPTMPLFAHPQR